MLAAAGTWWPLAISLGLWLLARPGRSPPVDPGWELAQADVQQRLALEQQNLELRRLSAAKSTFLAHISHELRTPLNGVLGFADLLLEGSAGPLTAAQAEFLSDIRASGTHLLKLINEILDYSKLEAGHTELASEPVELWRPVEEAVQMLRGVAQAKGVALGTRLDREARVKGDALRLKQCAVNLIGNAVKFTPPAGSVQVTVEEKGAVVQLVVADSGVGIAAEDQALIFEPFTQVDTTESRAHAGSGLGLSLVKQLVERMAGTVRVASEPGRGATFTVELPRDASRLLLTAPSAPRRQEVLVAEDDDATRFLVCRVLAANGLRVRPAANGLRAVEALAERLPDLLLLDLMMPELDGFGVLQRLSALGGTGRVKVLVYSAIEPTADELPRLLAHGAEVLLKGAVTTQDVVARVLAMLGTAPQRSAA